MTPLRERLKYYPDYIDDPDGLEGFRQAVRSNGGHDMADVNYNSLGRLIDTIERLRRERDAALSQTLPAPGEVERAYVAGFEQGWEYPRDTSPTQAAEEYARGFLATVAVANDEGVLQMDREAFARLDDHEPGSMGWRMITEPSGGDCVGVHAFAEHRRAAARLATSRSQHEGASS